MKDAENYDHYKKIKFLGEGSYGKVYLVECERDKVISFRSQNVLSSKLIYLKCQLKNEI